MRGIEFSKCNSYRSLFEGFYKEKYDWYIYDSEIISNQANEICDSRILQHELEDLLFDEALLIVFMNLQVFPKGEKPRKIKDYDDFMSSSCSFVVLVSDVYCFEIYTKNDEDILRFIRNAEICGGVNIRIKTDADDARCGFVF